MERISNNVGKIEPISRSRNFWKITRNFKKILVNLLLFFLVLMKFMRDNCPIANCRLTAVTGVEPIGRGGRQHSNWWLGGQLLPCPMHAGYGPVILRSYTVSRQVIWQQLGPYFLSTSQLLQCLQSNSWVAKPPSKCFSNQLR